MRRQILASAFAILIAWMAVDLLLHLLILAPLYARDPHLWRPLEQMNAALIHTIRLLLIAVFEAIYVLLVRPKSLRAGILFGALMGLALGSAAGFGTYIHSPIPLALAWGWFAGGFLKALLAGVILGRMVNR